MNGVKGNIMRKKNVAKWCLLSIQKQEGCCLHSDQSGYSYKALGSNMTRMYLTSSRAIEIKCKICVSFNYIQVLLRNNLEFHS